MPCIVLWRIAASKARWPELQMRPLVRRKVGAAVVDQSGICHRRKGCASTTSTDFPPAAPLLGDHGAESRVGKINRLGNYREERLRGEMV